MQEKNTWFDAPHANGVADQTFTDRVGKYHESRKTSHRALLLWLGTLTACLLLCLAVWAGSNGHF